MNHYIYDEGGYLLGTATVGVPSSTTVPYPDEKGLFRFENGEWLLVMGVTADGGVTYKREECAPIKAERTVLHTEDTGHGRLVYVRNAVGDTEMFLSGLFMSRSCDEGPVVAPCLPYCMGIKDVAVVGLGLGRDANEAAAITSVTKVDVLEINPAVVTHQPTYSPPLDAKVNVIETDAEVYFNATESPMYDAIFADPEDATYDHSTGLFHKETFQAYKSRLNPTGFLAHRVFFRTAENRSLFLNTLYSVFKNVVVVADECVIASDNDIPAAAGTPWVPDNAFVNDKSNTLLADGVRSAKDLNAYI